LKPAEMGLDGEARLSVEVTEEEARNQIQVYLPANQQKEILDIGVEQYLEDHKEELEAYDKGNEDDALVWSVTESDSQE